MGLNLVKYLKINLYCKSPIKTNFKLQSQIVVLMEILNILVISLVNSWLKMIKLEVRRGVNI